MDQRPPRLTPGPPVWSGADPWSVIHAAVASFRGPHDVAAADRRGWFRRVLSGQDAPISAPGRTVVDPRQAWTRVRVQIAQLTSAAQGFAARSSTSPRSTPARLTTVFHAQRVGQFFRQHRQVLRQDAQILAYDMVFSPPPCRSALASPGARRTGSTSQARGLDDLAAAAVWPLDDAATQDRLDQALAADPARLRDRPAGRPDPLATGQDRRRRPS